MLHIIDEKIKEYNEKFNKDSIIENITNQIFEIELPEETLRMLKKISKESL